MFHTLEVVKWSQVQADRHNFDEIRWDPALVETMLEKLRGIDGVRLQNVQENIGTPYYAFNTMQLRALPAELRPPPGTATGGNKA